MRLFLFSILLFLKPAFGIENVSFNVDEISVNGWQLKDVNLSLFDITHPSQQFSLSSKQLSLPKPFSDFKFFDIHCKKFTWENHSIVCRQGRAKIKSQSIGLHPFTAKPFSFSFSVKENKSQLSIISQHFAEGNLSITAKQKDESWVVSIKSTGILLQPFLSLLKDTNIAVDEMTSGTVNADIDLKGKGAKLNHVVVKAFFDSVSLQANTGKTAVEALDLAINISASQKKGVWHWVNNNHIKQGEIYVEPFYMEVKDQSLHFKSKGRYDNNGTFVFEKVSFHHPNIVDIVANGTIKNTTPIGIDSAHIKTDIIDLKYFSTHYLSPFLEQTEGEGIGLQGHIKSIINITQSKIKKVETESFNISVTDKKQRIAVDNAQGVIHWSSESGSTGLESKTSKIKWDKIKIFSIPIEANELDFLLNNRGVELLQPRSLDVLGGFFDIKEFSWQHQKGDEEKVHFTGGMRNLSLEQLTQALDWTPLAGTISGDIPGVNYGNKTLTIDGDLKVEVFDGVITINQLASSGLLTDFSKLNMTMEVENLDLYAITQKIKMGEIKGRISGHIRNAYFENWQPVTFYAWFGTPENDNSPHRISQKAVENIASIGGGGAADVISKGFLRFFDTFGYDRIGFGCYLYQGVCQLMGVEAAKQGYYIIKGGGLPRIDVVGFNPRVDWKLLIKRLSRLTDTDKVIVE
jgi:hypothetical protein